MHHKFFKHLLCMFGCFICFFSTIQADNHTAIRDKQAHCEQILKKLKKAKGLLPDADPQIRVSPNALPDRSVVIAMMQFSSNTIFIQEDTYDICMQHMGQDSLNGLAFILAHELAHFLKKHTVRQKFIKQFQEGIESDAAFVDQVERSTDTLRSDLETVKQEFKEIAEKYNIRKNEAEADLEAGFMTYLAGYEALKAGPRFLELAYQVFEINRNRNKYASLDERKEIIAQTGRKLDSLVHIYETGNLLATAGEYDYAVRCYDYVSQFYQSKEIFNNLAVLSIYDVVKDLEVGNLPYAVPLSLETQLFSRDRFVDGEMTQAQIDSIKAIDQVKIRKLDRAIRYLDRALDMDSDYGAAIVNKSIAQLYQYVVRGNSLISYDNTMDFLTFAEAEVLKGRQLSPRLSKQALSDVYCQLAIIKDVQGSRTAADSLNNISLSLHPDNLYAKLNKDVYAGTTSSVKDHFMQKEPGMLQCESEEKPFGKFTMEDILVDSLDRWNMNVKIWQDPEVKDAPVNIRLQYAEKHHFGIYNISVRRGSLEKERITFFTTNPNYSEATACASIKLGSPADLIPNAYGLNPKTTKITNGRYESYGKKFAESFDDTHNFFSGIVFKIEGSEVSEFSIFEKMKPHDSTL